jgi:tetratricopeptide (TPR) repeat protein
MQTKRAPRRLAYLGVAVVFFTAPARAQAVDCRPTAAPSQVSPLVRDERRSREPRARDLLSTELQALESLLASTSAASPDRLPLLRRLAEDYAELEYVALKEQAMSLAQNSRQRAQQRYTSLRDEYPSYPLLDSVRYYLGYEYEQGGDLANARRAYYELIQGHPDSKYIPQAYLAFGEMFFADAAAGDPSKYALAEQAYEKVVSYPPPANHVYGYAWFKLAHTFWRAGEPSKAVDAFQKVRSWARTFAQDPTAASVSQAAARDLLALQRACPTLPP